MSNNYQKQRSPASRVGVDGAKIKFIRESKGLTQLYVATFLGVTADTVSRWENRKYPTVKWENVQKLAEALEVNVSEIIDQGDEQLGEEQKEEITDTSTIEKFVHSKNRIVFLVTLICIIFIAAFLFVILPNEEQVHITATRFLPRHIPAGQSFPVVVRVDSSGEQPFSFILQEQLPQGFVVMRALPEIASKNTEMNTYKWISNSRQSPFFLAYLAKASSGSGPSVPVTFTGRIKSDNAPQFQQEVAGDNALDISEYHWVDSNGNGVIGDDEILMVYSSADVLKNLGIDMDHIKTLWSAGRYTWNVSSNEFEIDPK